MFRVLLQPGLGCCVGFCCTHDIETGDAGQVTDFLFRFFEPMAREKSPKLRACFVSKKSSFKAVHRPGSLGEIRNFCGIASS